MNARRLTVCALACVLLVAPRPSRAVDDTAGKERIGFRAGGLATFDGLNTAYGDGWGLTLFFTQKVAHRFLLDFRLGALYPGALKLKELDDQITSTPGIEGSMRFLYLSVGPMLGFPVGGQYSGYLAAGLGIYSVSMTFKNSITPMDFSDQKVGANGGLGLARRLSTNWSLDLNAVVHYIKTGHTSTDLYYSFTNGADPPVMLDISLGVAVDLR